MLGSCICKLEEKLQETVILLQDLTVKVQLLTAVTLRRLMERVKELEVRFRCFFN